MSNSNWHKMIKEIIKGFPKANRVPKLNSTFRQVKRRMISVKRINSADDLFRNSQALDILLLDQT